MTITNTIKGALWMLIFCTLLPIGDTLARLLRETGAHPSQVLFLEYGIICLVLLGFITPVPVNVMLNAPLKKWHFIRSLSFFMASFCWLFVIKFIPLTQLFTIGFLAPIFSTILSSFFFQDRINRHKVSALLIGLLGVLVVIRPGFTQVSPYLLLGLLSPMFWSMMIISTKRLSQDYSKRTLLFLMSLGTVVLSAPMAIYYWVPMPLLFWGIIFLLALIGFTAHRSLIAAYALAPVSVIAPLEFTTLISATLCGWLFFGEPMDTWTLAGAFLILGSNIYITIKTHQKVRPVSSHLDM
ncbi:MAG: hypothetical protein CL521_04825 [Actinobacteria bacterium]|nr:hypothetical protein [Actinomycetota bacterium]|tara:strand:+ start:29 stop:919 length:891 start_codon:yes stop_codon:yes gene_type:complete